MLMKWIKVLGFAALLRDAISETNLKLLILWRCENIEFQFINEKNSTDNLHE